MITKGIIKSISGAGNRCIVRLPLFESASSTAPVELEALVNITPGMFNNLFVNDVVFVSFEENALEKPIIIGKLYKGTSFEDTTAGGMGILDTLRVNTAATVPCSTLFKYPASNSAAYTNFNTPKKIADYIKWLEQLTKKLFNQLEDHFRCFKNWTQWQLQPENVEVDDGDLDIEYHITDALKYQAENAECKLCGNNCTKDKTRCYSRLGTDTIYPNT